MKRNNIIRNIFIVIVIILIGISSAYFYAQGNSEIQSIATGKLSLDYTTTETTFTEDTNLYPINLSNVENKGAKIGFTVFNNGNENVYTTISLGNMVIPTALKNEYFGWTLYKENKAVTSGTFKFLGSETKYPLLEEEIYRK